MDFLNDVSQIFVIIGQVISGVIVGLFTNPTEALSQLKEVFRQFSEAHL